MMSFLVPILSRNEVKSKWHTLEKEKTVGNTEYLIKTKMANTSRNQKAGLRQKNWLKLQQGR